MYDCFGYTAIEASDAVAGLQVLQSDVRIDLLVTNVGLPGGMNGRQMADAVRVGRPDHKVLFITGYAENAAVGNGHLEPGMAVPTKPFVMEALASRIKDLILGPRLPSGRQPPGQRPSAVREVEPRRRTRRFPAPCGRGTASLQDIR